MSAKTMQGCNWVFTLNNPQPEENPSFWPSRYVVYQLERGEEGTPHYQGYIVFYSNKTLSAVKKMSLNPFLSRFQPSIGMSKMVNLFCAPITQLILLLASQC